MKRIVFVCSGNTCRSPIAEGIAKRVFRDKLRDELHVSSAGISAVDGLPASRGAIEVAAKRSVDLSAHRSRRLTRQILREADLVVVMTQKHLESVIAMEPSAAGYTRLLGDFADGEDVEVGDPVGGGVDAYDRTFDAIENCIEGMGKRLVDFEGWKRR